jgi:cytochrome c5
MKNMIRFFTVSTLASILFYFVIVPNKAFGQKKTQEETLAIFPSNISDIFSNSCVHCHSDQGTSKAKIMMNLSHWDNYSLKKQAKKGKQIEKKVSTGAMPPSGYLKKYPDAALTPKQIESISSWSNSLKRSKL